MLDKVYDEKRRLILWLTILLAAGFAASSLASYFVSKNSIRHEIVTNELPLTTDNVYSEIQKDLIRTVFVSSMMANDTFLRDWVLDGEKNSGRIVRYLKEIQKKYHAVTSFFVSEQTRAYYYEDGILKIVAQDDPYDVWYFRTRALNAPYEINLDTDEAHNDTLTIFVNYRVHDYQGRLIGVTGVGLTVDEVRKLIDRYQDRYRRNVYLTDKTGRIMLHGHDYRPAAGNIHHTPGLNKLADTILRHPQGIYQYQRDNSVYQLNVRYIPELDWYLFVEKSEDAAFADIRRTLFLNLGICALITVVVTLLTALSIGRHQNRLKQAVDTHTAELNAALEETRKANTAKNWMMAYVGHDLRTPLANIVHYVHLLGTVPADEARRYRTTIEQSVSHQLELIDDLMEYARGELDHLKLVPAPVYLHAFLYELAVQGEAMARQRRNRFSLVVADGVPPVAVLDTKRLRQALMNLLFNACKFTEHGDIRLEIGFASDASDRLRLTVADTGPGIAESDQPGIFMPFERAASSLPGNGLGLAIADQIVRKMGGELHVDSAPGQGARFWFDLALETATEADVLQPVQAFDTPQPFGTGLQVLVVDDNPTTQDFLGEILALADFDVTYATDAGIAEACCIDTHFDALLVAHTLPGQDAWDLLGKLHRRLGGAIPPVIAYSAVPLRRPADFQEYLDFDAELLKPVSANSLLQTIARLLGRHSASVS